MAEEAAASGHKKPRRRDRFSFRLSTLTVHLDSTVHSGIAVPMKSPFANTFAGPKTGACAKTTSTLRNRVRAFTT
jgi:hypothetical protein